MRIRALPAFSALGLAALTVAACSANSDSSSSGSTHEGEDASADALEPDANGPDASGEDDADVRVDADASPPKCTQDGWCHTELPPDEILEDVWADGHGIAWAVSESGHVLRWDGASWSIQFSAPTKLHAIWGSSPSDLWIGGDDGLRRGQGPSSNAIAWTAVDTPGDASIPIRTLWGATADDVWAAGGMTGIEYPYLHSARVVHYDGAWAVDPMSTREISVAKVFGTSPTDVWLAGSITDGATFRDRGLIFRREARDGSFEWSEQTLPEVRNGHPYERRTARGGIALTPTSLWLLGNDYFLVGQSSNGGNDFTWTYGDPISAYEHWAFLDGWGTSSTDVWLIANPPLVRHWDGARWTTARISNDPKLPVLADRDLRAIAGGGPDDVWVAGSRIALHKQAQRAH